MKNDTLTQDEIKKLKSYLRRGDITIIAKRAGVTRHTANVLLNNIQRTHECPNSSSAEDIIEAAIELIEERIKKIEELRERFTKIENSGYKEDNAL